MGPNRTAVEKTIESLPVVADTYAAQVQMLRSLADAVDRDPGIATLWKEYRASLDDLLERAKDGDTDLAEALNELRTSAVGDPPNA